jgi:hypothetical protein
MLVLLLMIISFSSPLSGFRFQVSGFRFQVFGLSAFQTNQVRSIRITSGSRSMNFLN